MRPPSLSGSDTRRGCDALAPPAAAEEDRPAALRRPDVAPPGLADRGDASASEWSGVAVHACCWTAETVLLRKGGIGER